MLRFSRFPIFLSILQYRTDDRGVYRIFGLRAGRYLVSAGGDSEMGGVMPGAVDYPRAWYPDAADENQAKIIEVKAGDEITGIDIKLGVAKRTYVAVGRIVDDETGKPIAGANLKCKKVKGADDYLMVGGSLHPPKSDEQGNFRLIGLTPGEYYLNIAPAGIVDKDSFLIGGRGYYSEGARFEVQGADAAGIEIRVKRGATISGVAVVEDADPSAKSSLSQTMLVAGPEFSLSLFAEYDPPALDAMMPAVSGIGSDGGFSIKGVRPGKVRIGVFRDARGPLKIMRIERGGVEMSEGIVVTGREEISGVRIVFGKGSGVIRGQINVAGGAFPKDLRMFVTYSKKGPLFEGDMFRSFFGDSGSYAGVDDKGRFVIEGLAPGEYQLTLSTAPGEFQLMLMTAPGKNPDSPPKPDDRIPAPVTQKVIVAKGQEAQVTMTLDLSEKNQREKQ